jgi:hypothetical protein
MVSIAWTKSVSSRFIDLFILCIVVIKKNYENIKSHLLKLNNDNCVIKKNYENIKSFVKT